MVSLVFLLVNVIWGFLRFINLEVGKIGLGVCCENRVDGVLERLKGLGVEVVIWSFRFSEVWEVECFRI